jgi:hypothetical protein
MLDALVISPCTPQSLFSPVSIITWTVAVMKRLVCSLVPCAPPPSGPNIPLSTLFPNTSSPCASLRARSSLKSSMLSRDVYFETENGIIPFILVIIIITDVSVRSCLYALSVSRILYSFNGLKILLFLCTKE